MGANPTRSSRGTRASVIDSRRGHLVREYVRHASAGVVSFKVENASG